MTERDARLAVARGRARPSAGGACRRVVPADRVGEIAERHPGLKLIVDHMAVPPASKGAAAYRFQPDLLALAKYPNVAVKATGQAGYAEDAYPFRSFHEHLHRCLMHSGRIGCSGAPTSPGCRARGGNAWSVFTEELPWLKGRDLALVMGEALCNWVAGASPAERFYGRSAAARDCRVAFGSSL